MPMRILAGSALLTISALLATASAEETVFKWVDNNGVTHYSAQPPDGIAFERISIQHAGGAALPTQADSPGPSAATGPDAETEAEHVLPELAETRVEPPDPELVAERCRQARENLSWLTERTQLLFEDETGQTRRLDEDERQNLIEENRAFIDQWC